MGSEKCFPRADRRHGLGRSCLMSQRDPRHRQVCRTSGGRTVRVDSGIKHSKKRPSLKAIQDRPLVFYQSKVASYAEHEMASLVSPGTSPGTSSGIHNGCGAICEKPARKRWAAAKTDKGYRRVTQNTNVPIGMHSAGTGRTLPIWSWLISDNVLHAAI